MPVFIESLLAAAISHKKCEKSVIKGEKDEPVSSPTVWWGGSHYSKWESEILLNEKGEAHRYWLFYDNDGALVKKFQLPDPEERLFGCNTNR